MCVILVSIKCDNTYLNFKTKCFIVLFFQYNCDPVQKRNAKKEKIKYILGNVLYVLSFLLIKKKTIAKVKNNK